MSASTFKSEDIKIPQAPEPVVHKDAQSAAKGLSMIPKMSLTYSPNFWQVLYDLGAVGN